MVFSKIKEKSKKDAQDSVPTVIITAFFILLFSFLFNTSIFAQSEDAALTDGSSQEEINYYLDRNGIEPRFVQRLIWDSDPYVRRYVVIIEQITQRRDRSLSYLEVERLETVTSFAEVSLVAGNYRYRLEVYDLLDELSYTTVWHEFEVIRAIQPDVTSFSPGAFYLDEDEEWVITVRGRNFLPRTEFVLTDGSSRIRPSAVTVDGNSARLEFSGGSLSPGQYFIYARNPGGLDDTYDSAFIITNKKPFDFNISLSYAPVIPLYGYLFDNYEYDGKMQEAPFPGGFFPLGAAARLSFLPVKRVWGNIGVELSGSFTFLSGEREYYSSQAYLINAHASFLYQKHFLKRTFYFNAHAGAGVFSLLDFNFNFGSFNSDNITKHYISVIGGLSFTYMFKKPFFATMGADFIHIFSTGEDSPMPGVIRPFIAVGIQL